MNKLKFFLSASIAAALTISCSDEGGDDPGSPSIESETYELVSKTSDQFTYAEVDSRERCTDGGKLEQRTETYNNTVNYSISNNIMTWENRWREDTLNFKGTSNNLIGTWTRTKNKDASCRKETETWCRRESDDCLETYEYCLEWDDYYEECLDSYSYCSEYRCEEYIEETYLSCKEGWDITKAVFTENTVGITREECETDEMTDGDIWRQGDGSWKMRPINCNSYEIYKGTDKVTVREGGNNNVEVSASNGKSCKMSEPSKAQKEAACKEAWDKYHQTEEYWNDYYGDFLWKGFYDCLKNDMPKGFWTDDEEEGAAKPLAKAKAKATAKFKPLLKKKK